ncbi:MAG: ATP-binding protein [Acidimicrobiaceae bacterium]|nr:ATP-binding protein [Acidimicrobiaceae bacterium]
MTFEQITTLVAQGESETVEFKRTTGTRREGTATVCAMLNHRGGVVLFGVERDGSITGQQVSERTLEEVSAEIQRIDPPAFPEIERVWISADLEVVAVHVKRGVSPPYQYRGVSYRRVGNTTRRMSADEYNRILFERMHSERRWENQSAVGWTVDDLDVVEVRNTVAEAVRIGRLNDPGSREPGDMLRGLGLFRDGVPLRAAAVLFGDTERLDSKCRNVCCVWLVFGDLIVQSS